MISNFGEPHFVNLAAGMMFLLLLLALTSCGTLDIASTRRLGLPRLQPRQNRALFKTLGQ
jgi:hypothetical protein